MVDRVFGIDILGFGSCGFVLLFGGSVLFYMEYELNYRSVEFIKWIVVGVRYLWREVCVGMCSFFFFVEMFGILNFFIMDVY